MTNIWKILPIERDIEMTLKTNKKFIKKEGAFRGTQMLKT